MAKLVIIFITTKYFGIFFCFEFTIQTRTFILSSFRHIRQKTFYSFPASAKHIRRVVENKGLKYNANSAEKCAL